MSHTRGPWRWEINEKHKSVQLCGGKPQYDLTVMDFVRYGMSGAAPRFIQDGLLYRCEKWAVPVEGREHHKTWFQAIDHPDAALIAAAPDLLEALTFMVARFAGSGSCGEDFRAIKEARAAIAKATGGKP